MAQTCDHLDQIKIILQSKNGYYSQSSTIVTIFVYDQNDIWEIYPKQNEPPWHSILVFF